TTLYPHRSILFPYTTLFRSRKIFEGTFGGPVPDTAKTNFMLSGSYDAEDSQAVIFAQTLNGSVQANAPTPSRNVLFAGTWNHQRSESTRLNSSHRTISYAVF